VSVERLAEAIRESGPCVVLTGAGISTESGIPDFRTPTGVWAQFDPLEYGSIDAFRRDPAKVWELYGERYRMLAAAEPNDGHRAIAELERRGLVEAVVTQNIDRLHERAGSREVVEVHGSIRSASCPACGRVHGLDEVLALVDEGTPRCLSCGTVLKPDVVFFGELLPQQRSTAPRSSPQPRACCSSSARRSRCTRWPACHSTPCAPGAGSRSSIAARPPSTAARTSASRALRASCSPRCSRGSTAGRARCRCSAWKEREQP
jgi:NAD-dependent SIR2 family protein deacetylase